MRRRWISHGHGREVEVSKLLTVMTSCGTAGVAGLRVLAGPPDFELIFWAVSISPPLVHRPFAALRRGRHRYHIS